MSKQLEIVVYRSHKLFYIARLNSTSEWEWLGKDGTWYKHNTITIRFNSYREALSTLKNYFIVYEKKGIYLEKKVSIRFKAKLK